MTRFPVDQADLNHALKELKAIRISPFLETRVAVDEYSVFEYRFDDGQECVHYAITGPWNDAPQDQLVQWMLKLRKVSSSWGPRP